MPSKRVVRTREGSIGENLEASVFEIPREVLGDLDLLERFRSARPILVRHRAMVLLPTRLERTNMKRLCAIFMTVVTAIVLMSSARMNAAAHEKKQEFTMVRAGKVVASRCLPNAAAQRRYSGVEHQQFPRLAGSLVPGQAVGPRRTNPTHVPRVSRSSLSPL